MSNPGILILSCWGVGTLVRLVPMLASRRLGTDHWYWLVYTRTLRQTRVFPPELPYKLDVAQWYPPLFPLLLALLPHAFLRRFGRSISVLLESLSLLLLGTVSWLTTHDTVFVVSAVAAYTIIPMCVEYNFQLNPRGLGAFLLSALVLSLFAYETTGLWGWLALCIGLGSVVCLLHKMTLQMLAFYLILHAVVSSTVLPLILLALIPIAAAAVSGGFYLKVLRAHADIVGFWNRNRRWLNAHQYYDSEIYGKPHDDSALLHRPGFSGILKHLRSLTLANPLVLCLPLLMYKPDGSPFTQFCKEWVAIFYLWALLTSIIPQLRCFGAGVFYTYNSGLPVAYLSAGLIVSGDTPALIVGVLAFVCLTQILRSTLKRRNQKDSGRTEGLEAIAESLTGLPHGNVFTIPFGLSEPLAYKTGKQLVWGGHGYGFKKLEPYFPIMQVPLETVMRREDVRYVVVDRTYLELDNVLNGDVYLRPMLSQGPFDLFELEEDQSDDSDGGGDKSAEVAKCVC